MMFGSQNFSYRTGPQADQSRSRNSNALDFRYTPGGRQRSEICRNIHSDQTQTCSLSAAISRDILRASRGRHFQKNLIVTATEYGFDGVRAWSRVKIVSGLALDHGCPDLAHFKSSRRHISTTLPLLPMRPLWVKSRGQERSLVRQLGL